MNTPHITTLRTALETAYINGATASSLAYRPQFVSNNHKEGKKVLSSVEDELLACDQFQISVAFITMNGRITIDQLGKIQPDTRNQVLASALETLGITENRYSGIPTIRMEMEKYNLRQPEFLDERGSFIVKLYKESKNDYEDMSNDEETNNLIVFCKTPRTRKEICDYLGLNSVTYAIQTYVNPLVEAGVIKLSIPDKPKSPKQLYYSGEREK